MIANAAPHCPGAVTAYCEGQKRRAASWSAVSGHRESLRIRPHPNHRWASTESRPSLNVARCHKLSTSALRPADAHILQTPARESYCIRHTCQTVIHSHHRYRTAFNNRSFATSEYVVVPWTHNRHKLTLTWTHMLREQAWCPDWAARFRASWGSLSEAASRWDADPGPLDTTTCDLHPGVAYVVVQ